MMFIFVWLGSHKNYFQFVQPKVTPYLPIYTTLLFNDKFGLPSSLQWILNAHEQFFMTFLKRYTFFSLNKYTMQEPKITLTDQYIDTNTQDIDTCTKIYKWKVILFVSWDGSELALYF